MMDLYHPIGIVSYLPIDMDSGEIKPAQAIAKEVRINFEPRFILSVIIVAIKYLELWF